MNEGGCKLTGLGKYNVSGDITTLLNEVGNVRDLTPYGNYDGVFYHLFGQLGIPCVDIVGASKLILPATTLAKHCYEGMFFNCTSLITAPELPATTLADHCYENIFYNCTSLVTAPELPATTLANNCYYGMFYECTSLATAPELPATTLAEECYRYMFYNCTSLVTAPELPVTTLAKDCYNEMFTGCTSLTVAPELPATTLAEGCYYCMFSGCTNLNCITCLATDISAGVPVDWVSGVSSTGTFIKHPNMNNWWVGTSGIPSGWTVEDAEL